jgi:hypothetical protein
MLIGVSPVGCTSIRIAATLGYEYRLLYYAMLLNVIELNIMLL